MNSEKYYTPEFEELHFGLECEQSRYVRDEWGDITGELVWLPHIMDQWGFALSNTSYRIKYLDKEDIESLGFQEIGQEEYYLNGDLNSWCIERFSALHCYSYYRINSGDKIWNVGLEIKNKSELQKLMKQLGIK